MGSVEKERPVIIAAVTDAQTLGLIHPTTNISGTSDMIDVEAEIKMVAELVPNAKTVGILYSSGETNSILMVKQMHQQLAAQGLKGIDFAISNEAEISTIVDVACRKSDVIIAPTDNTVAATITLISNIANKYKKPLIVSDNMLVKFGPLAARGVDYKECGKKSAQIAYDIIIGGKKPQDITITQVQNSKIFVNQNTLDTLGLVIPETLKNDVILITQD
jgi:putative ABC transport system substrate-binding protein